ncbi:MAG: SDR family oxidoreductase, partial [Bryobacteraceae bacterium]|nr:SDR family oxidoreductase [Bryobacteraceae bacterium]
PLSESRETNITGTLRMLELARGCTALRKFAHVSTVYVAGLQTGAIAERVHREEREFTTTYEQTKAEAEREVILESFVPAAVYRLSTAIGDSATGAIRQLNWFHKIARLAQWLPALPGEPVRNTPVDLIASDWSADVLEFLFQQRFEAGIVYHVCAGESHSIDLPDLVELLFSESKRRPKRSLHCNESLRFLLPRLTLEQTFSTRNTDVGLAGSRLLERPSIARWLPLVLQQLRA